MTNKISGPKPPSTGVVGGSGGPVIRPMYGIFIRDNLSRFKTEIGVTLNDTKKALKTKGELTPAEASKAKAAVQHLDSAMKALKPVFKDLGAPKSATATDAAAGMGRPGSGPIAMYGIVFRDDLSRFRNEVQSNIQDINAAINNGTLKGVEKTEAQKAIGYLNAAMRDLGAAPNPWE
jgi:hypothetical protein